MDLEVMKQDAEEYKAILNCLLYLCQEVFLKKKNKSVPEGIPFRI